MKVRPLRFVSGLIDGVDWAKPGEVMEISDASALALIDSGDVEAVIDDEPDAPKRRGRKAVETAAAPVPADVETAAVEA